MIGVFDSGFGGLTIFHDLRKALPDYDFIYLGDNARAPYGSRSYETIYRYTLGFFYCYVFRGIINVLSFYSLQIIRNHWKRKGQKQEQKKVFHADRQLID